MHSTAFYDQTPNGNHLRQKKEFPFLEIYPISSSVIAENNFSLDVDEWDDWMKWDGPTTSASTPPLDSLYSTASGSSQSDWTPPLNLSAITNIKPELDGTDFDHMALDAPYDMEFDDTNANANSANARNPGLGFSNANASSALRGGADQQRLYQGYSTLSLAEERALQEIAMPSSFRHSIPSLSFAHKECLTASLTSGSNDTDRESLYSPEPETKIRGKKNLKRKTSIKDGKEEGELSQSRKRGHNAIEKRYRTNLNDKIDLLRQSVPALSVSCQSLTIAEGEVQSHTNSQLDDGEADGGKGDLGAPEKYGKAVILTRAVEYIGHLEDCTERLGRETAALKGRVVAFEKLAMSGSLQMCYAASVTPEKAKSLENIKADFQHSTHIKAEMIKAEPKVSKKRKSRKSMS